MACAVSIIIPAYNAQQFLAETVESVVGQTVRDWELVIVDDGSIDETGSIAEAYARQDARIRCVRQDNRGLSAARNRGLLEADASTQFVIFLDSDDVWEPDALEKLTAALDGDRKAVAAYGLARFIDGSTRPILRGVCESRCRIRATMMEDRVESLPGDRPSTFETFIVSGCIATPGVCLIRRSALERVGEFDTSLRQCEDWDMYIRLSRHGGFRFLDTVLLGYRLHGTNMTRNRRVQRMMERRVLRKAMDSPENDARRRELARRSYRCGQRFFLGYKLKYLRSSLTEGDYRRALYEACYALGHAARYVRGKP